MKRKYKLAGSLMAGVMIVSILTTGCAKDVDCYVAGEHVHLYTNPDSGICRYIDSEKDHIGKFERSDDYLKMTEELRLVSDNELYSISDNQDYFNNLIENRSKNRRQAYVYDYIYGPYYGYGFGINPSSGKTEYYYGLHTGYHYGYEWQDISLDENTDNLVRDITYTIKVYKIENGKVISKEFNALEDITEDYKYFSNVVIIEHIGNSYHLEKVNKR